MAASPYTPPAPTVNPTYSFIYTVPVSYTPESDETYINFKLLPVRECREIPVNDLNSLWNCTKCGNDDKYCQPVKNGEKVFLQIPTNERDVLYHAVFLFDVNDEIIESSVPTNVYFVHDILNGNSYINLNIDIDETILADCFYAKVIGYKCAIDEEALSICIADRISTYGESYSLASYTCLGAACDDTVSYFSNMFCRQDCGDTLLIEGIYPKYDCDGNFYGLPYEGDANSTHRLYFRVAATLEKTDYTFTETIVNNKKVKSQQVESFLLRTQKVPPYVAEQFAKVFNSKEIWIDGVQYKRANKITKNFEEGQSWIISETLIRECDEINFLCNK